MNTRSRAFEAIQQTLLAALLGMIVWLASWPNAVRRLDEFDVARNLVAYYSLREFASHLPTSAESAGGSRVLTCIHCGHSDASGCTYDTLKFDSGRRINRLYIDIVWPQPERFDICLATHPQSDLQQHSEIKVFDVRSPASVWLPFTEYQLIEDRSGRWAVIRTLTAASPAIANATPDELYRLFLPRRWSDAIVYLRAAGVLPDPERIDLTEPKMMTFLGTASLSNSNVSVLGIPMSLDVSLVWIGIFLGALGLWLVGPYLAFKKSAGEEFNPVSVLVIDTAASRRELLEIAILTFSFVLSVLPLVILGCQIRAACAYGGLSTYPIVLSAFGATIASTVFGIVFREFQFVRRGRISTAAS